MRNVGRWLAETRLGRVTFYFATLGFIAALVYLLVWQEVNRRTTPIVQRIEVIERTDPIDLLRECLRTPECRRLFRHPELQRVERAERGDALQPAPVAGQPSEPAPAGGDQNPKQQQGGGGEKPAPEKPGGTDSPQPSPAPVTTPSAVQPEAKGPPEPKAPAPHDPLPQVAGEAVEGVVGKVCSLADHVAKLC